MAAPVNRLELFTSGQPQPVDVRSLEMELVRLWKSAAEAGQSGLIQPVTRAAVVTLVYVVRGDQAAVEATARIARVTEHAPCRALVVNLTDQPRETPLLAWASAHCHRVSGGRQVCCEQVTLVATATGLPGVPSVILPLLIPDLPVFLFWPEILADGGGFEELHEALADDVDYLVVDSAGARDPDRAVLFMADLAADGGLHEEPRDLNWSRLLPWREALADLFEPADIRGWLSDLTTIEVEALAGPPCPDAVVCPLRPLYYVSWLAGRLAWERQGVERAENFLEMTFSRGSRSAGAADRTATARIRLHDGEGRRGTLTQVHLRFTSDREIELEHSGDRFTAIGRQAGREIHRKILPRRVASDESLLCGELDRRGADPIFRAVLFDTAALVAEAGGTGRAARP